MPRIPEFGGLTAPRDQTRFVQASQSRDAEAISREGQNLQAVFDVAQQRDDESAFNGFRAALNEWENSEVYDPEKGAVTRQGQAAFGLSKSLPESLDGFVSSYNMDGMSSKAKRALKDLANSRKEQLTSWAGRHELQQRNVYNQGQYEANNMTSARRAASLDLSMAKGEVIQLRQRAIGHYRNKGLSVEEVEASTFEDEQAFHSGVLGNLMSLKRYDEAQNYFDQFSGRMALDSMVKAREELDGVKSDIRIMETVDEVLTVAGPGAFTASDSENLKATIVQLESAGQRFQEGQITRSNKGALGEYQVMPETAVQPGFGINGVDATVEEIQANPERYADELARVGSEYAEAMLRKYKGDIAKVLGSYNAGPGLVDQLVEAHGSDWLSHAPEETKGYVSKGKKNVKKVGRSNASLSMQEYDNILASKFKDPEEYSRARKVLKARVSEMKAAEKERNDSEKDEIWELSVTGVPLADMPPELVESVTSHSPKDIARIQKRESEGFAADPEAYVELTEFPPEELAKVNIRDYRGRLSENDYEKWADRIAKAKIGDTEELNEVLTLATQVSASVGEFGIKGPKLAKAKAFIAQKVDLEQQRVKRKLSADERQKVIDQALMKGEVLSGRWFIPDADKQRFQVEDEDAEKFVPDGEIRDQIIAALEDELIEPTAENIAARYALATR